MWPQNLPLLFPRQCFSLQRVQNKGGLEEEVCMTYHVQPEPKDCPGLPEVYKLKMDNICIKVQQQQQKKLLKFLPFEMEFLKHFVLENPNISI